MFKGWKTVFGFTFARRAGTRGYKIATLGAAVALAALIALGMVVAEKLSKDDVKSTQIDAVICVDLPELEALAGFPGLYGGVTYQRAESVEAACEIAGRRALVAVAEGDEISVIIPENTDITRSDARGYSDFVGEYINYAIMGERDAQVYSYSDIYQEREDGAAAVREALGFLLPYLTMLIMYFMILAYGQGVANSVVSEKTSKLMDMFLVSTKPAGVILGKTLAIASAGIIQVTIWVAGIVGGLLAGRALVLMINPLSGLSLIAFMNALGALGGLFTPTGVIMAAIVVILGFLLYCSLAAIGGAAASKPEDLGTTNMLFTLFLVASFFLCMYNGVLDGEAANEVTWLNYMPFSAILITPGSLLLGGMTAAQGVISAGLILVCSLIMMYAAGRVYAMLVFYRGNPLNPKKLFAMLKSEKQ